MAKVGRDPQGLIVHHDQDSVYTSYLWLRELLIEDKVVVSYCERGAKDNLRTRNALLVTRDGCLEELEWLIGRQVEYYNFERRDPSLDYRSPMEYLINEGIVPKTLAENGAKSGSVPGAQAQYAEHEKTALLSPPRDPEALAQNLLRVLEDDNLRIQLAKAGHERIKEFTRERSTDLLEEFLLQHTKRKEGNKNA